MRRDEVESPELAPSPRRSLQVTLELSPREGGSYTQLSLSASLPTTLPPRERRLLAMLAFWSGWPVNVVLRVDATTAGWCEWWTDAFCAVRARDLEVRFELSAPASPVGSRPEGHRRTRSRGDKHGAHRSAERPHRSARRVTNANEAAQALSSNAACVPGKSRTPALNCRQRRIGATRPWLRANPGSRSRAICRASRQPPPG